ncbi:D-2-hydroxyacid dehydrogenase [Pelagibius sp. CAU 1746]|uniref:D-2-hydroxyacid dehydrogenase n=1 Tax=Pelagibius sp. CAU 1746 TaxID=3140370 RepID=UPI00325C22A3
MSKVRVVLHPAHPFGVADFLSSVSEIQLEQPRDNAAVAACLQDGAEALVTYTWRDEFLSPSLRWVAGTGAGTEQYPLERLRARDVVLTTAAGAHSGTVAEHAFALLLSLTRRIGEAVRHMTESRWTPLVGEELAGKRMAVIGLGRIGEEIARRAANWDMQVAGMKRNPGNYAGCLQDVRGEDALQDLCAWADVLMLAAPAKPDGSALIGAKELELLGAGWLVNVGRGSLVDADALRAALSQGALRGAGLDVTSPEPLPEDSPLWLSPKVVVSAHYAGSSSGYAARWGRIFTQNLQALREGADWENRLI